MNKGKFTLHYFGGNGRAIVARAILSYAKADFDNKIIEMNDWGKIKTSGLCEFLQVPILEHNGKKYSQSLAIDLYLARTFGLYGKNIEEEYQIDSLVCTHDDLFPLICKHVFAKDKAAFDEFVKKYEQFAEAIEKRYVALGKKKYFLGDHFTLADIYITAVFSNFSRIAGDKCPLKAKAPGLSALIQKVKEDELKDFFAKYYVSAAPF